MPQWIRVISWLCPQLWASIRSTRPSRVDISHIYPPARHSIAFLLLPRVPRVTLSSSLSPWITAPLSLSLLPLLSFSFAFEWRAIELLRADKRETQFKLRLLAVVTTVIITLAFHGDSMHTCMGPMRQYVASASKFTELSFLRSRKMNQ